MPNFSNEQISILRRLHNRPGWHSIHSLKSVCGGDDHFGELLLPLIESGMIDLNPKRRTVCILPDGDGYMADLAAGVVSAGKVEIAPEPVPEPIAVPPATVDPPAQPASSDAAEQPKQSSTAHPGTPSGASFEEMARFLFEHAANADTDQSTGLLKIAAGAFAIASAVNALSASIDHFLGAQINNR